MRHAPQTFALILTCFLASPLLADDSAREIIERGMKARSEKPELLEKRRCEVIMLQGKVYDRQQQETVEIPTTGEIQVEWPSSFRWNNEMTSRDGKTRRNWAVNVDKGWADLPGTLPVEMNIIQVEECKMEMYGRWLATLLPLKDKAFTLEALKDSKIGDDDVSVVKVTMRFRPDAYLSFAKRNGHLLKVAYKAKEGGAERRKEHIFSDYKAFDGLMLPTKMTDMQQFGGQPALKAAEWTITGYKFVDKFPADTFTMPENKKKK